MKTKLLFIAAIITIGIFFIGCKKFELENIPNQIKNNNPTKKEVRLMGSVNTESKNNARIMGEIINNGGSITGNKDFYFSFWLEPSNGDTIAKGEYIIKNSNGTTIYQSITDENGIDWKFLEIGTYYLEVSGEYNDTTFYYNNISVIVTDGGIVPPNNNATAPVNIKNMTVTSAEINISVAINKTEYAAVTTSSWFFVKRINGTNFTHSATTMVGDSIFFNLVIPTASCSVEFNGGYEDNSVGGVWLTASLPSGNPSILYAGPENYWKVIITVSQNIVTLAAPNGAILKTGTIGNAPIIPGNNGDDYAHDNTIRWSGRKHFLKFTGNNFYCEYKKNESAWTQLSGITSINNNYYEINLPDTANGEISIRYGEMTAQFTPSENMQNSMYYSEGVIKKNI